MMHATPREEANMKARQRAREWARKTLGSMKREGTKALPRSSGTFSSPPIVIDGDDDDPRRFALDDGVSMEGSVDGREGTRTTTTTTTTECHAPSLRERMMSTIGIEEGESYEEDVFHDALEYLPTSTMVGRDIDANAEDERRISTAPRIIYHPTITRNEAREPIGISFSTIVSKPDP